MRLFTIMVKEGCFKNFYLAFPMMIVLTPPSRNQCEDSASCHMWSPDYISWNQGNNHWGRGGGEGVSRLRGPMWNRLYQGLDFLTPTVPCSNREVTRTFGSLGISDNSSAISKSPEKIQVFSSFLWMAPTSMAIVSFAKHRENRCCIDCVVMRNWCLCC